MTPDKDLLDEVTERILSVASPVRIILFGSAAEKRMGRDSDIENHKDNPAMVIYPAMKKGRELYHAASR